MPQKVGDVLQVSALCQQVGRAGVPEALRPVMLRLNSQPDHAPGNEARDGAAAHRTEWLAPGYEHFRALAVRPRAVDVPPNRCSDLWLDGKLLQPAPLRTAHGKTVPLPVNVRQADPHGFTASQSVNRIQQHECLCSNGNRGFSFYGA